MTSSAYRQFIHSSRNDQQSTFLEAANRIQVSTTHIEKDFWVCWTLNALYHERPFEAPRLLFKGGTSLSKAYGLIKRFSEDIDITVFRDDIGETASVDDLETLSNRRRKEKINAINCACCNYVTSQLFPFLSAQLAEATNGKGHVVKDDADPTGQTLLVRYPKVEKSENGYRESAVKVALGARSALVPNSPHSIEPYIAGELADLNLTVANVSTIEAKRTVWDKVVITHGLRHRYKQYGVFPQDAKGVVRHYYDLHCLFHSKVGRLALEDHELCEDCVRHARLFFGRGGGYYNKAKPGEFAITPVDGMIDALGRDYNSTKGMIFGTPPAIEEIFASVQKVERFINAP